ncbi:hypothetical protein PV328_006131 [Microctonus aethiopoides]|uniref:Inositol polyphosphate 1-phosphatase n=1 Tax=Microctonus aethiopoides TaxID=144406 RepID=A0AA39FP84_9HYME|nr:hypothetical protein PV328_006131 [Microctonus aethiopoides]
MTEGLKLLKVLLRASEKAGNIARVCRQNQALFKLLIQEKKDDEKNPRFFQDFKTLADVLIQECIRHEIKQEFPELAKMVRGEETNVFSNTLGKTVVVEVRPSCPETTELLSVVLDNDVETAQLLAIEIHREITLAEVPIDGTLDDCDVDIDINDLGIWIDPIDATADYINGKTLVDEATGLHLSGLRCVTVLIGAYSRSSGHAILGVVNQPFYSNNDSQWRGHCYWGFSNGEKCQCSFVKPNCMNKVAIISRVEDQNVREKLEENGYHLIAVAGAGYKILSIAIGLADVYILSKPTTFRWDTCGPQALLRSLGGGIIDFAKFVNNTNSNDLDIKYYENETSFANRGGLIAYRDQTSLEDLRKSLVVHTKL